MFEIVHGVEEPPLGLYEIQIHRFIAKARWRGGGWISRLTAVRRAEPHDLIHRGNLHLLELATARDLGRES
jgi:hypothetical protein